MRMVDIIEKKRDGGKLTKEEIEFFVNGYVRGDIPDYQASALLMAIYFRHMDYDETLNLTLAMENSGDKLDLSGINGIKVDKHSTGGVGDKTSLVLAPMVAALGGKVAKMSGRGLGHTGGTIDKLESIPGFNTSLSEEAFVKQVNDIGIAIIASNTKHKIKVSCDRLLNNMISGNILVDAGAKNYKFKYPYLFYYFTFQST